MIAFHVGCAYNESMQYTIRNIPEALDTALRERAKQEKRSLNEVVIQALVRAMGFTRDAIRHRDLSDVAGTWREDPAFNQAISDQHSVDEELWK